jgi:hypothetical protein
VTKLVAFAATCVVDGTAVNTFNNNTYPIRLGKCWHVMMIDVPKAPAGPLESNLSEDRNLSSTVAVLVRGSNSGMNKVSMPSFVPSGTYEEVIDWNSSLPYGKYFHSCLANDKLRAKSKSILTFMKQTHLRLQNMELTSFSPWGDMRLSPFGTTATIWPILPALDDR